MRKHSSQAMAYVELIDRSTLDNVSSPLQEIFEPKRCSGESDRRLRGTDAQRHVCYSVYIE